MAVAVALFALLWAGGVAGQWMGHVRGDEGTFASLFLFLAGLIVLLGARTRRDTLALIGVALLGFAVEAIGVRSGFPFGVYAYTGVLQPQLLGVPVVMGFAWMALVAFACDLTRRFCLSPWPAAIIAALWTTAIDLIIDPLAANHFGYWTWANEGNYFGIPLTNFVGWFLTGLLACRTIGPRPQPNFWADFVGMAILLFFALIALANSLPLVAFLGFGLCVFRIVSVSLPATARHKQ